ncbi:AraC family transcriptional regulator [Labrys monachus]|uniref:AraC-like DNA-binding protein n=1 Tax=Labrys monachus TaxID=217067 RepID=A0ABU0FJN7_9HYPH|nr:helix-turn-helix transcriptional regulator [Labrys monachus]MDQ0394824.1 AraC-like DNA-binding protein [Labrys monachus]
MKRQPAGHPLFRTLRAAQTRGAAVALHAHDEAQLIFAASGTMQVYTKSGRWLVPPQLAVWVPSGVPHWTDVLSDAELWMIYWDPSASQEWAPSDSLNRAFALKVTPLLRELIFAAFGTNATPERTELVVRLILHELTETPDAPTFVPLPASAIGRRVADLVFADPRSQLDIGELASRAATSVRTISRLFPAETGLTFKAWRQRARIVLAIDQLSAGNAISQVAVHAGFASTAAFCFAFRQVTNMTPTAFLDHATRRLVESRKGAVA